MNNIEINEKVCEDISPFEIKKIYKYKEATEYNLNKAKQLFIVKNYEQSFREYSAMLRYAIKNNDIDLISYLENKLVFFELLFFQPLINILEVKSLK